MEKTFENALHELEGIVKKLESGNVELEEAIDEYTEAMKLAKFCNEKLNDATNKVNKILTEDNELKEFNAE
ncbi:MAG: exodeoxyribonuclease VII small subunit [Bacilli bacterium]|nr:exodeoxyribonuclease VII small subunit [Bacilli bacterium]